ncbi:beta-galactosidase [Paenibacillus pectinilyticus]|uniref:Beta-galactosidase n=1 Tax=Paenibacillus pectinilyticus TaxID=512399 RepID=A0A1C0ZXH0_9BACL|nr:beta-galactosidase [Paenibacillus pectinilyticus]OCT12835.1 beta-galactosidase [Paenibacillus pectinilyticus]
MATKGQDWRTEQFRLGVCYYPEQWPENLWEDDYRRMKELGLSVVRVAEFAWSIFEPEEGRFEFDLFDRAIDLAHQYGLLVIMSTPTATPPAWLTAKYPEVLNAKQDGTVYQHGQRRHFNYNAPIYHELCARVVTQLAEHYKNHPAVVGWQIDNELNCEVNTFYSKADHTAFRVWLQEKYGSLDALNQAWGAVFWNQTYSDWSQVHLTRPTPTNSPNPHQALDEKRFFSDSAIFFAKLQSDILREKAPNHWVTTNGMFGHLDSHQMMDESLDVFAYDSYPNFSTILPDKGDRPLLDRKWSLNLSAARDVSPNFIIMEQQAGPGGWVNRIEMPSPKPGQMRLWTYQSIAHGADMVLYFRWRTATKGTEIYWHGLNDYHNRPNRRLEEAARVGEELNRIGAQLLGTTYQADVAILKDYDNEWDGELDVWHGPLTGRSISGWFKALQRHHIPTDTKYMRSSTTLAELAKYRLLIYPHPAIMPTSTAALLSKYVEGGGTLVLGCRSGYKDATGQCYMQPFPGPLAELCGIEVEDFTLVGPFQQLPDISWQTGAVLQGDAFVDILHVTSDNAEILASYASDYYAGKPALVRNKYGMGNAYYYGSAFTEEAAGALIAELGLVSPAAKWAELPEDVELAIRVQEGTDKRYAILMNYGHEERMITFLTPKRDMLTDTDLHGLVMMKAFDVYVIEI